jgi:hypothetical protein
LSHYKQRTEKNCLNCNAAIADRFCGVCGQENIEIKESFWGIIRHFFEDITHYDGKFLSTLKLLLTKPGFLPAEYLRGRRASYLHPIRLYVFTSAFFFLIFFTFYQKEENSFKVNSSASKLKKELRDSKIRLENVLNSKSATIDSVSTKNELAKVLRDIFLLEKDSTAIDKLESIDYSYNVISFSSNEKRKLYKTLKGYDSLQKVLPTLEKDGYFKNSIERQNLYLKEKYKNDGRQVINAIMNDFKHRVPQILFVSLPLFALLLKLLYIRRKNFFYASHIIFSIYLYCAFFILILLSLWLSSITSLLSRGLSVWVGIVFSVFCFFYFYKSLRIFYEQKRAKTIFKFLLLLLLLFILMLLLFLFFLLFSTFTIK